MPTHVKISIEPGIRELFLKQSPLFLTELTEHNKINVEILASDRHKNMAGLNQMDVFY
jgi:hypothetical protein